MNVSGDFAKKLQYVKAFGLAISTMSSPLKELFMYLAYGPSKPFDIKEKGVYNYKAGGYVRLFGEVMSFDDPGNILYGYGASAASYHPITTVYAGGIVQTFTNLNRGAPIVNTFTLDYLKDSYNVSRGIILYNTGRF